MVWLILLVAACSEPLSEGADEPLASAVEPCEEFSGDRRCTCVIDALKELRTQRAGVSEQQALVVCSRLESKWRRMQCDELANTMDEGPPHMPGRG